MIEHTSPSLSQNMGATETAVPQLSHNWLLAARVGWVLLAIIGVAILFTSLPGYAQTFVGRLSHISAQSQDDGTAVLAMLSGMASLGIALFSLGLSFFLFRRRFVEPMVAVFSFYLLLYAIVMAGPLEKWVSYWLDDIDPSLGLQTLLIMAPTIALFTLFPNGRLVPKWSRWLLIIIIPFSVIFFLFQLITSRQFAELDPAILTLMGVVWIGCFLAGLYAQYYRYRYVSTSLERQQTKWVIYGFSLWMSYILLSSIPYYYLETLTADASVPLWVSLSILGWFASLSIVPLCLTFAVARYRLWDIDIIINRTLVYGVLTAFVVIVYVLIVGAFGALFQTQGNWIVALIATGLIAVLFHPLRERWQRWVNQWLYGRRDEPFEVLAGLGQRLEETMSPETVYPTIVATVAQTLKLPYTALAVKRGGEMETAVSYGNTTKDEVIFPLAYQGEEIGQLIVAHRVGEDTFSDADERLLRNIARQTGTAVHALQLNNDLQHARQQIISSREEERRRLRRDLHDGLGPSLAAQMLKLGSARALLTEQPQLADQLLADMETDIENTLADVRRIVYDLRPPALDQLGLTGALRAYAETCTAGTEPPLIIDVEAVSKLANLPAAVEVAAYHIGRESLANVVHHAAASHCTVSLTIERGAHAHLQLRIQDDGRGFSETTQVGVGLTAMRERAAELGGSCTIESTLGQGTSITAVLPITEV